MIPQRRISHPSGHRSQRLTFWHCRIHIYWGRFHHHCHRRSLTPACIDWKGLRVALWPHCTHPVKRRTEVSSSIHFPTWKEVSGFGGKFWTGNVVGNFSASLCFHVQEPHQGLENPRRRDETSCFSSVIYLDFTLSFVQYLKVSFIFPLETGKKKRWGLG